MPSNNFKKFLTIFLTTIGLLTMGCAPTGPLPAPSSPPPRSTSRPDTAVRPEEQKEPEQRPGPRALASLQITEQGKELLERKNFDDAIRVLERAVSLNPGNGQNYYYLAEAWLQKRDIRQAEEFNSLARLYLEGDHTWMFKVEEQRKRIRNFFLAPQ